MGGAVGDALGAPFEGLWSHSIPDEEQLLESYAEYEGYPRGQYTDDTQLSLATVRAIVRRGDLVPFEIAREIAHLWKTESVIGPGGSCTRAAHQFLKTRDWTTCGAPVGQAGNGTAMRTAVVGLFFIPDSSELVEKVADVSRITHHDPRSIAGGVAIAKAVQLLVTTLWQSPLEFCEQIAESVRAIEPTFSAMIAKLPEWMAGPPSEIFPRIAASGQSTPEFDLPIITPFVIPTVLASLWSVCLHPDSWPHAVAHAIRLGGDVDTLGAIVGALLGAKLGVAAIPEHLQEAVVDSERIRILAIRYHALVSDGVTRPH
jgi:ADP-ribosyl-[dinitrogen reductase] hydrolase